MASFSEGSSSDNFSNVESAQLCHPCPVYTDQDSVASSSNSITCFHSSSDHFWSGWRLRQHCRRCAVSTDQELVASSSHKSCLQCQDSNSDNLRSASLQSGEFAQLCHRCASLYEKGRFCETFHSDDGGWSNCGSCGKLVHCGCVVSFNTYILLDLGGVICMECSKLNFLKRHFIEWSEKETWLWG